MIGTMFNKANLGLSFRIYLGRATLHESFRLSRQKQLACHLAS